MEAEEVSYEQEEGPVTSKWSWLFLLARVLVLISSFHANVGNFFAGIAEDICQHANYKNARSEFQEQAALELETLVGETPEEG